MAIGGVAIAVVLTASGILYNAYQQGGMVGVAIGRRAVGILDIVVGEPFLAEGGVYATCRSIYVDRDIRKTLLGGRVAAILVNQAKEWARQRQAVELMIYDTEGYLLRLLRGSEVDGANMVVRL